MSANTLPGAFAQGSDEIRVGLIGCGGRGTGAARNVVDAAPGVRIVAMADAFKDRLDESRTMLSGRLGDKFAVTDATCSSLLLNVTREVTSRDEPSAKCAVASTC